MMGERGDAKVEGLKKPSQIGIDITILKHGLIHKIKIFQVSDQCTVLYVSNV